MEEKNRAFFAGRRFAVVEASRDRAKYGNRALRAYRRTSSKCYRLTKQLWACSDNRIAVRFQSEYHDAAGNWFRADSNENWEFDADGLMRRREASINDRAIEKSERKFHWPLGPRPADNAGLGELAK
jgi:nuclear transport factor 2 (NTF2) superfamily protein